MPPEGAPRLREEWSDRMAGFRCAACEREGACDYEPHRHECPLCGAADVVFALGIDELPDELVAALLDVEPLDDHDNDED
ncbi:hypothetical protein BJA5080_03113 [Bradyrhizobium diazoefficiens SEMIA 5080]|uniref:Uncharacterized protein n=2 Tax=Nitrobacteraceae TaxID=41294 RepID=A0A837CB07_9BRAD|nr:hypothetical protein BJA5080_03113 [Bradyrhizobium diazoefficiens SEMIA 5080]